MPPASVPKTTPASRFTFPTLSTRLLLPPPRLARLPGRSPGGRSPRSPSRSLRRTLRLHPCPAPLHLPHPCPRRMRHRRRERRRGAGVRRATIGPRSGRRRRRDYRRRAPLSTSSSRLVNINTRQSGRQHTMLDMRQGKRTDLETALDIFGLPNGGMIQPASRCRDSLGTPRRRLPSIRPLPSSDVGMRMCGGSERG